jgi:chromosome segregation ATPase
LKKELGKLEKENKKLKNKLTEKKDKYEVRDKAWLERCNKLKEQIDQTSKESLQQQHFLSVYIDQFHAIQAMLEKPSGNHTHPLPFATLFNFLHQRTDDINSQCLQLQAHLQETRHQVEATLSQLEQEKKKYECLDHEQISTLEKLEGIKQGKLDLEQRNKMLEHELNTALGQKQELSKKFKTVLQKTAMFVQEEFEV